MRKTKKLPSNNGDKMSLYKEGDIIFTKAYGRCVIEYIDKANKSMPGASVRDNDGKLHFVAAKDIITGD